MRFGLGLFAISILLILFSTDLIAQMPGRSIKNNSHRLTRFRGPNLKFPEYKRYSFAGVSINSMNYFGDLSPASNISSTDLNYSRPGFTLSYGRKYGPNYWWRISYSWGTLRGDDFDSADPNNEVAQYRYIRNLHFRNRISELAFTFHLDLLENPYTYLRRPGWTPYIFLGVALFHHNPKARVPESDVQTGYQFENAGEWVSLQPLGTEGQNTGLYNNKPYRRIQPAIPFGLGVTKRIADQWDISLEIGLRYLFFDYIDDVSGGYVDLGLFDDPMARAMSDRSQEITGGARAKPRDFTIIEGITSKHTYVGADGRSYTVYHGYGSDLHSSNIRGNINDRDIYIITSLKLSRIVKPYQKTRRFR